MCVFATMAYCNAYNCNFYQILLHTQVRGDDDKSEKFYL